MTTLTVKMPEMLSRRLRHEASERGMNRSALIRQSVEKMLDAADQPATGSCLSLAQDLAGCLDGPGDLATHPKHMKGFGQ
jgi:predicted transcriptional regulator